jgi:hypothetical protein
VHAYTHRPAPCFHLFIRQRGCRPCLLCQERPSYDLLSARSASVSIWRSSGRALTLSHAVNGCSMREWIARPVNALGYRMLLATFPQRTRILPTCTHQARIDAEPYVSYTVQVRPITRVVVCSGRTKPRRSMRFCYAAPRPERVLLLPSSNHHYQLADVAKAAHPTTIRR